MKVCVPLNNFNLLLFSSQQQKDYFVGCLLHFGSVIQCFGTSIVTHLAVLPNRNAQVADANNIVLCMIKLMSFIFDSELHSKQINIPVPHINDVS